MTAKAVPVATADLGLGATAAFFGREGGVSQGIYRGLNCGYGSGDDHALVEENRARVAHALGIAPQNLLTVFQTHSPQVLAVTGPHAHDDAPQADGMVSQTQALGLAILTADCAPILLADSGAGVIGAAHAGWKGALGGVIENTIDAMEALGASAASIRAAIGPTISQSNYEVGEEFRTRFIGDDPANEVYFAASSNADHFQFDLPAYCSARLSARGIQSIKDCGLCTYADEARFYSYRRATHKGEADYGRDISVIVLTP